MGRESIQDSARSRRGRQDEEHAREVTSSAQRRSASHSGREISPPRGQDFLDGVVRLGRGHGYGKRCPAEPSSVSQGIDLNQPGHGHQAGA